MARMITALGNEWNPAPPPSHKRNKPKRGQHTKFTQKARKIIIARDGALCVRCKRPYHNIHHITFASQGGPGVASNGACVCIKCHAWAHAGEIGRKWFERYREQNLLNLKVE